MDNDSQSVDCVGNYGQCNDIDNWHYSDRICDSCRYYIRDKLEDHHMISN